MRIKPLSVILFAFLFFDGCGKKEFFGNFLPFSVGTSWILEDEGGNRAEISVYGDSLSGYKDTIFKVFFLGKNIDFIKTPNYVSWKWYRTLVVNDREIELENRFYPFLEEPFVPEEERVIAYTAYFNEVGVYYSNRYTYVFERHGDGLTITINSNYFVATGDDTTRHQIIYIFTMAEDTGFKEITVVEDTLQHHFTLVDFRGG